MQWQWRRIRPRLLARLAPRRQLVVDAYIPPAPGSLIASRPFSFAAHATGVAFGIERADRAEHLNAVVQRWLSRRPSLDRPDPPRVRGTITIADLRAATDPAEHAAMLDAWAQDTWSAYADLHDLARRWIGLAEH
jgi:hypothetical protein